jgi:acetylornithine deacetylase/succinyl-diaminopimelate desuccinylase-like protein
MSVVAPAIDWDRANQEIVTHLCELLRIDTRNPPGNEGKVAEYLYEILQQAGIEA